MLRDAFVLSQLPAFMASPRLRSGVSGICLFFSEAIDWEICDSSELSSKPVMGDGSSPRGDYSVLRDRFLIPSHGRVQYWKP